ncbi:hypothetical protein [Idiomarina sp.]|mgnify:CR=1 FL=1|uniref:hypothetical protein n=1 Tax=Idiomarina sp. TaxID=1874361 RepID=UPI0025C26334|nr:hypothetical protein [Idiomarina sp.]
MPEKKRSNAQKAADRAYESKRADNPRFGGRCSPEQKEQLTRLKKLHGCDEKTLIFRALDFFEKNCSN